MKQYRTLLLALLAVLALTVCALAAEDEGDEPVTDTVVEVANQTVEIVSDPDAPQDNDELFYEYMLQLAREQMTPARPTREPTREPTRGVHEQEMGLRSGGADGSRPPASVETAGSKLTGNDKKAYDAAATWLGNILKEGSTITSAVLTIDIVNDLGVSTGPYTKAQLGVSNILYLGSDSKYHFTDEASNAMYALIDVDYSAVQSALLLDFPYQMFWMDKTNLVNGGNIPQPGLTGNAESASFDGSTISWPFAVAKEYSATNTIETADLDRTKINAAMTAAANAASIVMTNASNSDYEKLVAYKEAICAAVTYNDAAADENSNTPYGNPWQLIWAFDGDPNTNIVCEGYSKAFKYLCDLSTFEGDVQCYLVTGDMIGGTGAGAHMWNIVTLEGKNYLVDVTNCDGDEFTKTDALFLKGITEASSISFSGEDYVIDFYATVPQQWANHEHTSYYPEHNVAYKYAEDTVWRTAKPEILTLSTTDYEPPTIDYTAGPTGSNYSYCAEGTTLHLKPTSGTAYLILARYSSGKLVEVKVQEVSTECSIENMTVSTEWKIFSVNGMDTCVPQGAALPLTISNN